jgi:hypothetical protein
MLLRGTTNEQCNVRLGTIAEQLLTALADSIESGFGERMNRQYRLDSTFVYRQAKVLTTDQRICRAFYGTAFSACEEQANRSAASHLDPSGNPGWPPAASDNDIRPRLPEWIDVTKIAAQHNK